MKMKFLCVDIDGEITPICESDYVNDDGINLLSNLLTDDGGVELSDSSEWLNEGVRIAEQVSDKMVSAADWDRETWGAEIAPDGVKVYSLYDENYCQEFSLADFIIILKSWVKFINSELNIDSTYEVVA